MNDHHKKKQFLNLPKYIGGSEAFRKFIAENVRYPEAAIAARIEGSVIVEYDITDEGTVVNARVIKGLGFGCDEEAARVIGMLRYEKVRNRGLRVKIATKTTIHFKPPAAGFSITYTTTPQKEPEKKDGPVTYEYTITL